VWCSVAAATPENVTLADKLPAICAASLTKNGNGVEMKDASATRAKNTTQNKRMLRKSGDANTALHRLYGQIGISAV